MARAEPAGTTSPAAWRQPHKEAAATPPAHSSQQAVTPISRLAGIEEDLQPPGAQVEVGRVVVHVILAVVVLDAVRAARTLPDGGILLPGLVGRGGIVEEEVVGDVLDVRRAGLGAGLEADAARDAVVAGQGVVLRRRLVAAHAVVPDRERGPPIARERVGDEVDEGGPLLDEAAAARVVVAGVELHQGERGAGVAVDPVHVHVAAGVVGDDEGPGALGPDPAPAAVVDRAGGHERRAAGGVDVEDPVVGPRGRHPEVLEDGALDPDHVAAVEVDAGEPAAAAAVDRAAREGNVAAPARRRHGRGGGGTGGHGDLPGEEHAGVGGEGEGGVAAGVVRPGQVEDDDRVGMGAEGAVVLALDAGDGGGPDRQVVAAQPVDDRRGGVLVGEDRRVEVVLGGRAQGRLVSHHVVARAAAGEVAGVPLVVVLEDGVARPRLADADGAAGVGVVRGHDVPRAAAAQADPDRIAVHLVVADEVPGAAHDVDRVDPIVLEGVVRDRAVVVGGEVDAAARIVAAGVVDDDRLGGVLEADAVVGAGPARHRAARHRQLIVERGGSVPRDQDAVELRVLRGHAVDVHPVGGGDRDAVHVGSLGVEGPARDRDVVLARDRDQRRGGGRRGRGRDRRAAAQHQALVRGQHQGRAADGVGRGVEVDDEDGAGMRAPRAVDCRLGGRDRAGGVGHRDHLLAGLLDEGLAPGLDVEVGGDGEGRRRGGQGQGAESAASDVWVVHG